MTACYFFCMPCCLSKIPTYYIQRCVYDDTGENVIPTLNFLKRRFICGKEQREGKDIILFQKGNMMRSGGWYTQESIGCLPLDPMD